MRRVVLPPSLQGNEDLGGGGGEGRPASSFRRATGKGMRLQALQCDSVRERQARFCFGGGWGGWVAERDRAAFGKGGAGGSGSGWM